MPWACDQHLVSTLACTWTPPVAMCPRCIFVVLAMRWYEAIVCRTLPATHVQPPQCSDCLNATRGIPARPLALSHARACLTAAAPGSISGSSIIIIVILIISITRALLFFQPQDDDVPQEGDDGPPGDGTSRAGVRASCVRGSLGSGEASGFRLWGPQGFSSRGARESVLLPGGGRAKSQTQAGPALTGNLASTGRRWGPIGRPGVKCELRAHRT